MDIKRGFERRIALGWLLFGLILTPAVAIVVWLAIMKGPPGNAVLIEDRPPTSESRSIPTSEARQFAPASEEVVPEKTALLARTRTTDAATPIPAQLISAPSPTIGTVTVYVSGAVVKPGIYILTAGSRMSDAVNLAGGVSIDADLEAINLAARIGDEDHIIIPQRGAARIATETPLHPIQKQTPKATSVPVATSHVGTSDDGPQNSLQQKIDINKASATELEAIPGLGPVLAARIVAYRSAHGPFASIDDLIVVSGIKEGILAKVRDYIIVTP